MPGITTRSPGTRRRCRLRPRAGPQSKVWANAWNNKGVVLRALGRHRRGRGGGEARQRVGVGGVGGGRAPSPPAPPLKGRGARTRGRGSTGARWPRWSPGPSPRRGGRPKAGRGSRHATARSSSSRSFPRPLPLLILLTLVAPVFVARLPTLHAAQPTIRMAELRVFVRPSSHRAARGGLPLLP